YEGSNLSRSILFVKPDIIVIKDYGVSDEVKEYDQIFNLNHTLEINNDNNNVLIHSEKNKVRIKQLANASDPIILNPDESIPRGIISREFGEYTPTKQLVYRATGKRVEFITMINLNYKEDHDIKVKYNNNNSML